MLHLVSILRSCMRDITTSLGICSPVTTGYEVSCIMLCDDSSKVMLRTRRVFEGVGFRAHLSQPPLYAVHQRLGPQLLLHRRDNRRCRVPDVLIRLDTRPQQCILQTQCTRMVIGGRSWRPCA